MYVQQIVIFKDYYTDELMRRVNKWLNNPENYAEIIDIKFQTAIADDDDGYPFVEYLVMIRFTEKRK